MMLQLSIALVFALNILGAHSKAQLLDPLGAFSSGSEAPAKQIGNCICTPFYSCYDEESSSSLISVDDRMSLPVNTVISTSQEFDSNACEDILEVCCYRLTPNSPNSKLPPQSQAQSPPQNIPPQNSPPQNNPQSLEAMQTEEILANLPTTCTGDRQIASSGTKCGVRNPCGLDFAFSGFTDGQAQYGEFPWMVAVLTSNKGGAGEEKGAKNLFVGGGSLINPQVVLTAAHNLDHQNKIYTARVGEWNFASTSEPINHTDIRVKEVIIHPRYDPELKIYNVALLVLEHPAIIGETVGTICLASHPGERFDGVQDCIVSGWGKNVFGETGRYQRILKSVSVNIVDRSLRNDQCQSALQSTHLGSNFELHRGFLCAGDKGNDACTGDGGSPLVCPHPTNRGQYVQVGVAAWGIGCGQQGLPGVYWAISPMIGWIQCELDSLILRNFDARDKNLICAHKPKGPVSS